MVTKKTAPKTVKKVAPKKVISKSTAAKKPVSKKTAAKKAPAMQSFRVYKNVQPFNSFRVTRQTVYWIILLACIVVTQVYLLKIQMDIADLTDIILTQ